MPMWMEGGGGRLQCGLLLPPTTCLAHLPARPTSASPPFFSLLTWSRVKGQGMSPFLAPLLVGQGSGLPVDLKERAREKRGLKGFGARAKTWVGRGHTCCSGWRDLGHRAGKPSFAPRPQSLAAPLTWAALLAASRAEFGGLQLQKEGRAWVRVSPGKDLPSCLSGSYRGWSPLDR